MNIEEIRKNAPDGATHYFKHLDYISYWLVEDGIFLWSDLFCCWVDRHNLKYSRIISVDDLKPL